MRIAMVCSNHAVTDARVTYKQSQSLARMGHQVRVFGLSGKTPVDLPGVEVEVISPFRNGMRARATFAQKLWSPVLRWGPDVVTCHEPETAALGLLMRRRRGTKVVFDIHELWHESMADRFPRPARSMARGIFGHSLQAIARRCDWVTVVSPWNLAFYEKVRDGRRVDIIHNSPPPEMFPACTQDVDGPLFMAHEGNLDVGRGMVQILEALAAARRHVDVRLLLVGSIRSKARDLYERTVDDLDLANAIDSPGWVAYDEVGKVLSTAQIGIVAMQPSPNNYRSLSNKIYNYMCCAQAAIVPDGSATADLVRAVDSGLVVDTTRSEGIADAIVTLARDHELRRRLGENGRRAILDEYGWHKMEARLQHLYSHLG